MRITLNILMVNAKMVDILRKKKSFTAIGDHFHFLAETISILTSMMESRQLSRNISMPRSFLFTPFMLQMIYSSAMNILTLRMFQSPPPDNIFPDCAFQPGLI